MDTLSRLNDLHQRYDAGIPSAMLAVVQLGSREAAQLLHAEATTDFYRNMVRGQLDIIRNRRLDGSFYPSLLPDCRLYLSMYRTHRRLARDLRLIVNAAAPKAFAAE